MKKKRKDEEELEETEVETEAEGKFLDPKLTYEQHTGASKGIKVKIIKDKGSQLELHDIEGNYKYSISRHHFEKFYGPLTEK